jgi:hypothetical protein
MKTKGGASLYEVLKSASRSPGEGAPPAEPSAPATGEAGAPTLQERLAAYKAKKLAEVQSPLVPEPAVEVATPPPAAPASILLSPPEEPVRETAPSALGGPGERVFKLTYNTAAFGLLVGVGLLFVAYAIGVKVGRSRAAETAAELAATPEHPRPPAPAVRPAGEVRPPPAPPREMVIRLADWPYGKPEERVKANDAAARLQSSLDRANLKGSKIVEFRREPGGEKRLALLIDEWKEPLGEAAKARLTALQRLKIQNQWPFDKASFEVRPKPGGPQ